MNDREVNISSVAATVFGTPYFTELVFYYQIFNNYATINYPNTQNSFYTALFISWGCSHKNNSFCIWNGWVNITRTFELMCVYTSKDFEVGYGSQIYIYIWVVVQEIWFMQYFPQEETRFLSYWPEVRQKMNSPVSLCFKEKAGPPCTLSL